LNSIPVLSVDQQLTAEARIEAKHAKRTSQTRTFENLPSVESFLTGLSDTHQRVMSMLLKFGMVFPSITASSQTLADMARCSRRSVDSLLEELRNRNLMQSRQRWNTSTIKHLHPVFFHTRIKAKLWRLYDAYQYFYQQAPRYLLLYLLFSANCALENRYIYKHTSTLESDTQLYKKDIQPKVDTQSREVTPIKESRETILRELMEPFMEQPRPAIIEPDKDILREKRKQAALKISPLLREITPILHLTGKGQIRFTRYSDAALKHALERLNHWGVRDSLTNCRLFETACLSYYHTNKIDIDQVEEDILLKELGYAEASPICRQMNEPKPIAGSLMNIIAKPQSSFAKATADKQRHIRKVTPSAGQQSISDDPILKDAFSQLAQKLGYAHLLE
jgi:hypothetical protein